MRINLELDSTQWPEVWQSAYRILEQTIVPNQLRAWIQPLEFLKTEATEQGVKIYFTAPNDFSANWVRDRYKKTFEDAFSKVLGAPSELVFLIPETQSQSPVSFEPPTEHRASIMPPSSQADPLILSSPSGSGVALFLQENTVDARYTFDNFIVGASNQFTHAAAVAVAEQPGKQFNPLFIYSCPGLGKTHLLHAIGNHIISKNPNMRVVYVSAERFVNEMIDSLQHNRMSQFRTKYRDSFDLVLIDDIQFIAGKVKTEEEFFHTFNALHSTKRQIIVSSDRPPKEIEKLEERVRTRFEWGLVADIQPPEIETRIAILKAKAERDDIYLPDDVATFLATYVKTNVRELEGLLVKLQAQASLTGAEISLEMAKGELKSSIPEESSHFTIETIQAAVSKHFQIKVLDLKSSARSRNISLPRHIAMYLIRKYTGLGFKDIGLYFGGKDHSTIVHACSKIEKEIDVDPEVRETVEAVQNLL